MIDWAELADYMGYASVVDMVRDMYSKYSDFVAGDILGVSSTSFRLKRKELGVESRSVGAASGNDNNARDWGALVDALGYECECKMWYDLRVVKQIPYAVIRDIMRKACRHISVVRYGSGKRMQLPLLNKANLYCRCRRVIYLRTRPFCDNGGCADILDECRKKRKK